MIFLSLKRHYYFVALMVCLCTLFSAFVKGVEE